MERLGFLVRARCWGSEETGPRFFVGRGLVFLGRLWSGRFWGGRVVVWLVF